MTREQQRNEYVRINRAFENKWRPKIEKALKWKISSLIREVRFYGVEAGKRFIRRGAGNERLTSVVRKMYNEVGLRHARRTDRLLREQISKNGNFPTYFKRTGQATTWSEFIMNYLRMFLLEKVTFSVDETTREKMLKVLESGVEEGWGIDKIVDKMQEAGVKLARYQSARIVRTEVNRAANVGVQSQGETFEYELMKEWIAIKDNRTRGNPINGQDDHADHYHLNGQTVDFFGMFHDPRNGHELKHPGDPKAQAVDTINCRCNMSTKPKRDENGRLVPKKSRVSVIMPGEIRRPRTVTI